MAFSSPDALHHAENLPVQVPTFVRWEKGVRVSPYIRGLKQLRPMITALVDGRRARVFRYVEGELTEVADLRADTFVGDISESSTSPRAGKTSGSRGVTAADTAQKILDKGTERMLKEVKELVTDLATWDGFVLLGGENETLSALTSMLTGVKASRILENPSLWVEMSPAEVKEATREGASALSKRRQTDLLDQIMDRAYSHGTGCLGGKETFLALEAGSVDILVLSKGFVDSQSGLCRRLRGDGLRAGGRRPGVRKCPLGAAGRGRQVESAPDCGSGLRRWRRWLAPPRLSNFESARVGRAGGRLAE